MLSRFDRTRRLRSEHRGFLDRFAPEARAVLDDLLDKHAEYGVTQLDDLRVLEVAPIPERHGTVLEIAAKFSGRAQLHEAIAGLEELLHIA